MNPRTAALPVAGLALVATAATVTPVVADVHPSDLPTTSQVARLFPALEGGSREVFRSRTIDTPTRDCLAFRTPLRADSGRWAGYLDAEGDSIYFKGFADPTAFVYEFDTRREADRAFRTVRKHNARCEGAFEDADVANRRTEIGVPALGRARYAFRTRHDDFGISSVDHFVDVYAVTGKRLVNVRVQADGTRPGKRKVVRLAGLALHQAG
jgi:hypothetical protein